MNPQNAKKFEGAQRLLIAGRIVNGGRFARLGKLALPLLIAMSGVCTLSVPAQHSAERFDVNVSGADIRTLIDSVAKKQGLGVEVDPLVNGSVTISLNNKTMAETMQAIAKQAHLEFSIVDGMLRVKSKPRLTGAREIAPGDRSPASPAAAGAAASTATSGGASVDGHSSSIQNAGLVGPGGNVRIVKLNYAKATELAAKLRDLFGKDARIVPDDSTNSLMIVPLETSYENILGLIKTYDQMPDQILIEAQIIETSSSFAQQMGVNWGNLTTNAVFGTPRASVSVTNPAVKSPNVGVGFLFGSIDRQKLEATLQIAENEGNAKIISRPKVVTADRQPADIESGISYHIKTLSSVQSGAGASAAGVTGGLQEVSAGLNLHVTPEVVDTSLIRLTIDISSSEADEGKMVDGIPGVIKSSAKTSLIVREGVTATIGGLVKYTQSHNDSGVPFLKDLPLLGWLFRSTSVIKNNNELLIFITPHLLEKPTRATASAQ